MVKKIKKFKNIHSVGDSIVETPNSNSTVVTMDLPLLIILINAE